MAQLYPGVQPLPQSIAIEAAPAPVVHHSSAPWWLAGAGGVVAVVGGALWLGAAHAAQSQTSANGTTYNISWAQAQKDNGVGYLGPGRGHRRRDRAGGRHHLGRLALRKPRRELAGRGLAVKRAALLAAGAVVAAGACQLFPNPDAFQHLYALHHRRRLYVRRSGRASRRVTAGRSACATPGMAGRLTQAMLEHRMQATPDRRADDAEAGCRRRRTRGLSRWRRSAPRRRAGQWRAAGVPDLEGMDDGQIYATGRSIWRQSTNSSAMLSFVDHGDALADAVEKGQLDQIGFRPCCSTARSVGTSSRRWRCTASPAAMMA